ncbi:hypothetical protein GH714_043402 [Hevea brasiliensis]|uniref:Uncharacterized protein n=1 Tax=Hevea brasiliensis TaxID=3981 RepID=A0A6A6K3I9_HEVBR|nr:hypothetical protein GH714_043402 [Hevea brasiliensis]
MEDKESFWLMQLVEIKAKLSVKEFEARWIGGLVLMSRMRLARRHLLELWLKRTLPSRSELLRSVLAADLVGFHTYDYARHFVSACTRILELEGTPEGVEDQGRLTRVAAFPIGIDSDRFIRALEAPQVQDHIKDLKERFAGRKVMLGVDRLDMIKGIPQKILAFEKFLEENSLWRDKVVLLQIAVPTRTDVPEYQKLTSQVHEIVGRINGRFGTLTAVPIHHLDRSLDFHALCAVYAVTDVALVTSLRDGMNLVSYEFVACQDSKKGVLILSEISVSSEYAINMCQTHSQIILSELNDTVIEAQLRTRQVPPILPEEDAIKRYLQSNNRLLLLGFNATLTEPVDTARRRVDQIKEMELKLHPELKEILVALCSDPKTTIVVLSGSDRNVLDENFGEFDMWLAAEHGMFLRLTKGEWMTTMPEHSNMEWVDSVKHVLSTSQNGHPDHILNIVKHHLCGITNVEFGRLQARDMLQHLWTGPISNASVDVVQGSRSVEVRAVGVTKGAAIDRILGEIVHSKSMTSPIDYVLCIGHFLAKDEDVYTFFEPVLPSDGVGIARTKQTDGLKSPGERRPSLKLPASRSGSKSSQGRTQRPSSNPDKKLTNHSSGGGRRQSPEKISWNVLDLKGDNYFSCAVGRTRTNARYQLQSSDDVVSFLKKLANASS